MDKQTFSQLQMKEAAGNKAVDTMVSSGMKLGLGTGSTAVFAIRRIGELLARGALRDIYAFATSFQTEIECEKLGIPFFPLNSRKLAGSLDLIIDGADEVDPQRRLIKGGGGALLLEKIAAYNSAACAITVDETKLTGSLGASFPIPVEVVVEARVCACRALEALGAAVTLREALRKAGPVITDRGNLILDIRFAAPIDPAAMEHEINQIPGVVENGLFTRVDPVIYIGRSDGTVEIRKPEVTK